MINAIKSIQGIGRYTKVNTQLDLSKNHLIFGFNGTGKSTLSDMFYSLSSEQNVSSLNKRKTLKFQDGTEPEEMRVVLQTELDELIFEDGRWNEEYPVYVFNDHYIDDYLFVETGHDLSEKTIVFGNIPARLARKKVDLQMEFDGTLDKIGDTILARKELCGNLGLGKQKIKKEGCEKRLEKIATISLYTPSRREQIETAMNNQVIFDTRIKKIDSWIEMLSCGTRFINASNISYIKRLDKELQITPKVTNKEIAEHISHYMNHADINWLSAGVKYQSDDQHCPFCGQELKGDRLKKLSGQLAKFIDSRQKKKADDISNKMQKVLMFFDADILAEMFFALDNIREENDAENLLHSKAKRLLEGFLVDCPERNDIFLSLYNKIKNKIDNPYDEVVLDENEKKVSSAIYGIVNNYEKFSICLEYEREQLEKKIHNSTKYAAQKALYDASYGEANESIVEMISLAKNALKLIEDIDLCQKEIDNRFETKKIDEINSFLNELNVNFHVCLEEKRYSVQIKGYQPVEYDKGNKVLCSEGERRMLALAYFLQEISMTTGEKVIVIDDPISSLDISRKSVVAFKLVELMEQENTQVIVLSHDISFAEKIDSLSNAEIGLKMTEITKDERYPFKSLVLRDYIVSDEEIYYKIIKEAEESEDINRKILALMAMRPYTFLKTGMNGADERYIEIEGRATHLVHSIYSRSKRVPYSPKKYGKIRMRTYCKRVAKYTKESIDEIKIVPEDWDFEGIDFNNAWEIYNTFGIDSIDNLRKKAIVLRVVLETTLYALVEKKKFDPERIGNEYSKAIRGKTGEKKEMCKELNRLYDLSKKYHHGTEGKSTLGISALNPDEMRYFDSIINEIHEWVIQHPDELNNNLIM